MSEIKMLPLHHRRGQQDLRASLHEQSPPKTDDENPQPQGRWLKEFIIAWIKMSWKDVLAMLLLGGAMEGIYQAPLASTKTFPITFDTSGNIVYPEFAYPDRGWVISVPLSGVLAVFIPLAVFLVAQIRIRSFWDLNNSVIGLLYSLILGTLCQVVIKVLIGGFRPYWLEVCRPDVTLAATNNQTGLNGVGFRQIMYTVDVCTNPNKGQLKTAMTSFPSGHSTAAAASAVFLFLWLNAKLKVWSNFQPAFGWLALTFAPLLLGALMCLTLTIDMAHHWYDILAGATIGSVSAVASYRANYAAIWDWRYNHIPLRRDRVVDYAGFSGDAALEDHILTGTGRHGRVKPGYLAKPVRPVHPLAEYYLIIRKPSLGWGRPRDVESRHERRLRKHASRRRGVEQASGEGPWAQSGVVGLPNGSPEMARSRDVRSHQLGGSEDMV